MRKLAIIENGLVQNVIVIPDGDAGDKEIEIRNGIELNDLPVGKGWTYDGVNFLPPAKTEEELAFEAEIESLRLKQEAAKAKLISLGLTQEEVEALIGA